MANNVYELFLDMVKYEQSFAAYWIYVALTRGYLQKHDPPARMYEVCYTEKEIAELYEMERRDVLGLERIKLYATAIGSGVFAFYFAKMPDEANDLHEKIYGQRACKWHSVYRQHRLTAIYEQDRQCSRSFQEIKADVQQFPYYVGEWDGK